MNDIITVIQESMFQLSIVIIIPFICWLILRKKIKQSFLCWIGLTKPKITNTKHLFIVIGLQILLWVVMIPAMSSAAMNSPTTAYSKNGFNATAVICILIFSFIKTGLSEEILFRGFIAKRFIHQLGFMRGNIIQGTIFGLMHSYIYLSGCGLIVTAVVVVEAALSGMVSGYLNEKVCEGSIIPSWLLHAVCNCIPAFATFFLV